MSLSSHGTCQGLPGPRTLSCHIRRQNHVTLPTLLARHNTSINPSNMQEHNANTKRKSIYYLVLHKSSKICAVTMKTSLFSIRHLSQLPPRNRAQSHTRKYTHKYSHSFTIISFSFPGKAQSKNIHFGITLPRTTQHNMHSACCTRFAEWNCGNI